MYYQSKGLKDFAEPPGLLRSIMLVWINGPFTPEAIKEKCQDAVATKIGGFIPIPIPKLFAFRNRNYFTELDVEYLSPEYFQRYHLFLEEAKKRGLHIWLYDEGGYPSGAANGLVLKSNPDLCCRVLRHKRVDVCAGQWVEIPEKAKFVFFQSVGSTIMVPDRFRWQAPEDGKIRIIEEETRDYVDLLRAETTNRFIELTHQKYYQHSRKHFGSTIPCAFSDEALTPSALLKDQIPWSPLLPEEFEQRKGYNLIKQLPVLFQAPGQMTDAEKQVRIDFMDVVASLHAENYYGVLQQWCEDHHILSSAHLGGEDVMAGVVRHGFAHPMRMYRKMHIPGVDVIWRQVWLDRRTPDYPKYASSAAHQTGSPWVSNDSLGVYGNGITLQENKFLFDYFFVRGVNFFFQAHYNFSTKDGSMPGCHPIADRQADPFWKHKHLFNDYLARLTVMLGAGKPLVKTAFYYPIRDLWAEVDASSVVFIEIGLSFIEGPAVIRSVETASQEMLSHQCEYDYVDDDVLSDITGEKGIISIGPMRYDTLVMSPARFLPPLSAKKISQFVKNGGRLVLLDDIPRVAPEKGKSLESLLNLSHASPGTNVKRGKGEVFFRTCRNFADILEPVVKLVPESPDIRATARDLEDGSTVFFFTNEVFKPTEFTALLPDRGAVLQLDPLTGKTESLFSRKTAAGLTVNLALAPLGSALLLAGPNSAPAKSQWQKTNNSIQIGQGWQICPIRQYRVGLHDFEIHELKKKWCNCYLGRWQRFLGDDFSGDATYRVVFNCPKSLTEENPLLSLGRVESVAEVVLNGKKIGKGIWEPFEFDVQGMLSPGKNILEVTVTNSLAPALNSPRVRKDWAERKGPGWWQNRYQGGYDNLNHIIEKDSLELGGLLGPIVITGRKPVNL